MKTKKILLNTLPLLFVGGIMAYAAAPTGGYLPNATLDPDCAPNDTDCFVQLADDLTSVWNNADGTNADETSTDINYIGGNVGIGTTAPSVKLHTMGNIIAESPTDNVKLGLTPSFAGKSYVQAYDGPGSFTTLQLDGKELIFDAKDNSDFIFRSEANERMRIVGTNGNVGIGTTAPVSNFSVYDASGDFDIARFESTSNASVMRFLDSVDDASFGSLDGKAFISGTGNGNANPHLVVNNGGDVGVGIVDPLYPLHVSGINGGGNAMGIFRAFPLTASFASVGVDMGFNDDITTRLISYGNTDLRGEFAIQTFDGTSLVSRIHIDEKGDVGIGTTTPDSKLTVVGLPSGTNDSVIDGTLAGAVCITNLGNMYIDTDGTCAN